VSSKLSRMALISTVPVDKIPYLDNPELKINRNESTQMPFRYVKGEDGRPIMPEVRLWPAFTSLATYLTSRA
jgi:ribosome biogenesis SPOUT family RNA methylase Rps3